jgi:PIN domain nuclease of toxin-antitoxin system
MNILLDTCVILWFNLEPEKIRKDIRDLICDEGRQPLVSAVSCAEIACAMDRGRLQLDRHWKAWFRHFVDLNGWQVLDVDWKTIEEAYSLPEYPHRDPADRILIATARIHGMPIATADARIRGYPHVETIW